MKKVQSDCLLNQQICDISFAKSDVKYKEYEKCIFRNCDFGESKFVDVTFIECQFFDCNFKGVKMNQISLRNLLFSKCNFTMVDFTPIGRQVIYEFNFRSSLLDYAKFWSLKLKRMQFISCSMVGVDFFSSRSI